MMTLIKDGKSVVTKETILELLPTDSLDHTDCTIELGGIDFPLRTLDNPYSQGGHQDLHLGTPLIHEKLLVHHDQESLLEAGGNIERHECLPLSAWDTDKTIGPGVHKGCHDGLLIVIRGTFEFDCTRWECNAFRDNRAIRRTKDRVCPCPWQIPPSRGFTI
jgi:hypothetical protein